MNKQIKNAKIELWMNYNNLSQEEAEKKYYFWLGLQQIENSMENDDVVDWAKGIKGVVRKGDLLYWAEPCDIANENFMVLPKKPQKAEGLSLQAIISTYHSYVYSNQPQPCIGDVIKQIPKEFLPNIAAIEVVVSQGVIVDELIEYHQLETRLYKAILPKWLEKQKVICKGKQY